MKKLVMLAIGIALIFSLSSCFLEEPIVTQPIPEYTTQSPEYSKQVPVYRGMTVLSATADAETEAHMSPSFQMLGTGRAKDVEITSEDYYADLGEDILITIHISNPDGFEFLSVTLNDTKYSSYMFEYGSNMESIILKCNVGRESGTHDYTIDAIKYVDDQAIKDVVIRGNQTIRVIVSEYEHESNCRHDDPEKITVLEAADPTCQSDGLTEGIKCKKCNTIIVGQEVLARIDCIPSEWITDRESTLTEAGLMHTECVMCGQRLAEQTIHVKGSEGLAYTVHDDQETCTVIGMGTCVDTELIIPTYIEGYKVTAIADNAFANCDTITSLYVSDYVKTIGEKAFLSCVSLRNITFPASLQTIGDSAFHCCSNVENVYYNGDVEGWCSIDFVTGWSNPVGFGVQLYFRGELVFDLVIPDTVTVIDNHAFFGCQSLVSVTIGKGVTVIGDQAFSCCTNLAEVHLGSSVKIIEDCAFESTAVTNVVIPDSVESIGCEALFHCLSLVSVTIGESVKIIEPGAFLDCSSLEYITYHGTVAQWNGIMKEYVWDNGTGSYVICCSDGFVDKQGNAHYATGDCLHNDPTVFSRIPAKDSTCRENGLSYGVKCGLCHEMVIPQQIRPLIDCQESNWIVDQEATSQEDGYAHTECTVCGKKIAEETFSQGSTGLSYSVDSWQNTCTITGIGTCADNELRIPEFIDGHRVTAIQHSAFRECMSLTSVTIPDSVTKIGSFAFYGCNSLTSVTMNDSVESIGTWAFAWCESLTDARVSNSVKIIPERAFYYCRSLTDIHIGTSVESIGDYAFEGCASLTDLLIPNSVTSIGKYAFLLCRGLTAVTLSESLTHIGLQAFNSCSSLQSIVIPSSVQTMDMHAFANCTVLTIHCEAKAKPIGWDSKWNSSSRPVTWNYTGA